MENVGVLGKKQGWFGKNDGTGRLLLCLGKKAVKKKEILFSVCGKRSLAALAPSDEGAVAVRRLGERKLKKNRYP